MKATFWALPLCAAGLAMAVPAQAATMKAEFTGTIQNSNNGMGLFGGGSLNGLSFVITYLFDTTISVLGGPPNHQVYGGDVYGGSRPTPSLGVTMKVGAFTETISGAWHATHYVTDSPGFTDEAYYASAYGGQFTWINLILADPSEFLPDSLDSPFQLTDLSGLRGQVGGDFSFYNSPDRTTGQLALTGIKVSQVIDPPPAAVPLPAGLPLLAVALGALGWTARRRRG